MAKRPQFIEQRQEERRGRAERRSPETRRRGAGGWDGLDKRNTVERRFGIERRGIPDRRESD